MPEGPRLLLLDTSGRSGLVAVASGPEVLAERRLEDTRRHARDLAPVCGELLAGAGWSPRDLDGVAVTLGPGSYTGLRVGLMSARTLAYATGCALIGVGSFAVLAEQARPELALLDVVADAQQEKVYVQSFRRHEGGWEPLAPLAIREITDWRASRNPAAWVTGPGVDAYPHRMEGLRLLGPEERLPGAAGLLRLALARHRAGERDDVWSLEPLYLRRSAAEEQWERLGR
jgi:tRNA threonylcarbamoyladenosine biosynthesis protein TsaB